MKFLEDLKGKKIKKIQYYKEEKKPYECRAGWWTPALRKIILEDDTEIEPSDSLGYPGMDVFKKK